MWTFVTSVHRQNITPFVKNVCCAFFGIKLGDQNKTWAPYRVCRSYVSSLRYWKAKVFSIWYFNGLEGAEKTWQRMLFYSCVVDGYNVKNKHKIQYPPNLPCAVRPIHH